MKAKPGNITLAHKSLPVLYSLRNCPYAMRARIAIFYSAKPVELRDLVLSNKPEAMLLASPKGTVPVIVLSDSELAEPKQTVIEESIDIMLWALGESDPDDLLNRQHPEAFAEMLKLIHLFDHDFKTCLEAYKCAKRYKENNITQCRVACESFIEILEQRLAKQTFLMSSKPSLLDIALLPFIRQFARVERQWYLQSPYPQVRAWLNNYLQSPMFTKVMAKFPLWSPNNDIVLFGKS